MILQASHPAVSDTLCDSSQAQRLQNQSVYAEVVYRLSLYRYFLSLCYRRSVSIRLPTCTAISVALCTIFTVQSRVA